MCPSLSSTQNLWGIVGVCSEGGAGVGEGQREEWGGSGATRLGEGGGSKVADAAFDIGGIGSVA